MHVEERDRGWPRAQRTTQESKAVLSTAAVLNALGVGCVALADELARFSRPGAIAAYWLGLGLIFIPTGCAFATCRNMTRAVAAGVVSIFALATFAVFECYSPTRLTFSDEYQHFKTLADILQTGHLFSPNRTLPVSPFYPGLESTTAALRDLASMPTICAISVVIGVLHVMLTVSVFALCTEITDRPAIGGLATVIYATNGDYLFFNTYFSYETMGITFATLSALCAVKGVKANNPTKWGWFVACCVMVGIVAVTHHVSSYVAVAMVALVGIGWLRNGAQAQDKRWIAVGLIAMVACVGIWDGIVARGTGAYLATTFRNLLPGAAQHTLPTSAAAVVSVGTTPIASVKQIGVSSTIDRSWEYLWAALVAVLVSLGAWKCLRHRDTLATAGVTIAAGGVIGVVIAFGLRVASPNGEIATRLLSFAMIPAAAVVAIGVEAVLGPNRKAGGLRSVGVLALIIELLVVGGVEAGWPPSYARLPGPYVAGGRDRSVDLYELTAAEWVRKHLPAQSLFAADTTDAELLEAVGNVRTSNSVDVAYLFDSRTVDPQLRDVIRRLGIEYVLVNAQLAGKVPANQSLFPNDPFEGHYARGISGADLTKFEHVRGVTTVYAGGPVEIFEVKGLYADLP